MGRALGGSNTGARLALHTTVGPILQSSKLIGSERNEPAFRARFHKVTASKLHKGTGSHGPAVFFAPVRRFSITLCGFSRADLQALVLCIYTILHCPATGDGKQVASRTIVLPAIALLSKIAKRIGTKS